MGDAAHCDVCSPAAATLSSVPSAGSGAEAEERGEGGRGAIAGSSSPPGGEMERLGREEPALVAHAGRSAGACLSGELAARRRVAHRFFPPFCLFARADQWGQKAIRRKTTGTGRMKHLKLVQRRFRNGFQEGACCRLEEL